jgi:hypothetical protein
MSGGMKKITLTAETAKNMKVGDLLANQDKEGKVFGTITKITKAPGGWKNIYYDPTRRD